MNNFIQPGETMTLVAPYTVVSGAGAKVGAFFGVAVSDVASGVEGRFMMEGVFTLAKTTGTAWVQGDKLYWDDSGKKFATTGATGMMAGIAAADAASGDATGSVKLVDASSMLEGAEAAVADLVDNSGGAAADGTIGVVTLPILAGWNGSTDPSAAEATQIINACTANRDAVKELATKVNALLAALRLNGIILP